MLYNTAVVNRKIQYQKFGHSIVVDCVPTRPTTDIGAIGLDFGVNHAIATSEGKLIDNPRFLKQAQEKIKQIAQKARRKRIGKKGVKPSRRYRKAQKALNKIQSLVGRQRQDLPHQTSSKIVSDNSLIATEKLNLKGMTRKSKSKRKNKKQA